MVNKAYECLKVICDGTLRALTSNNDEIVAYSRSALKASVDGQPSIDRSDQKEIQKWIDDRKLNAVLLNITKEKNDLFSDLGYVPIVRNNGTKGGKGNEKLFWLDIEKYPESVEDLAEDNGDAVDFSSVAYTRAEPSTIKVFWFYKLIFKHGELKNRSLRGLALVTVIFSSLVLGLLYLICVSLVLVRSGQTFTSFDFFILLTNGLFTWNAWKKWFQPILNIPESRVIKAPLGFLALSELDAEIEMYRDKHRNQITRFTRFTSVCPICTSDIVLREGMPDQKAPLVGRCVESPYDHVYSFDRVTLKGKYLGY